MRSAVVLGLVAVGLVAGFLLATRPGSAQVGGLTGDVPTGGGVGLVVWSGGHVDDLIDAAAAQGCELVSAWTTP